jgi:putative RNA 2'-phosphotransferase
MPGSSDTDFEVAMSHAELSRLVSHALRHEPWAYELELDAAGWVPVGALLGAIREVGPAWEHVGRNDLALMVASSSKRRHELDGDRIRALYGHSVPGRIVKAEAVPPAVLFHGTSPRAWETIRTEGLMPMGRQYVHLSTDLAAAAQVGRRKAGMLVLLGIRAGEASAQGVRFWQGNEMVWLTDAVPAGFISVATAGG